MDKTHPDHKRLLAIIGAAESEAAHFDEQARQEVSRESDSTGFTHAARREANEQIAAGLRAAVAQLDMVLSRDTVKNYLEA